MISISRLQKLTEEAQALARRLDRDFTAALVYSPIYALKVGRALNRARKRRDRREQAWCDAVDRGAE